MFNYFLYARKSTDVEDKQVRSIDDQLAVLRALAKDEGLTIAQEFIEKQSAKMPGRPVFNEMLARIKKSFVKKVFGLNPSTSFGTGLTLHARDLW